MTPLPTPDSDVLWTIDETAAFLKCSVSHLYALTSRKEIPFNKPRGRLRFLRSEIMAWVRGGRVLTNAEVEAKADELLAKRRRRAV
ncbi:MAG: helix-turn-helix domain-containing protein [Methylacidiphilaceae bacterium]|nr:helix-turn-helix domain-containing protein [Candidatus Methylacidiphilaceae bacterium]